MARVIFHVDMDAFYVSVERRENPKLNGKAVIVGADPKSGTGRGVVMACSYEAREMGIRSGMPIGMAWRKVPTAVYLRPNYELYGAVSESVMNVLRSYADILEHVSIDEAFLDVTSKVRGFDDALEYAARVKAAVREREGLACTIGVAPNKSIAKIASDLAKPNGLQVVRPEEVVTFLDPLPVTKISGVGTQTAELLERVGVRTIRELARFPGAELKKILGKNSVWLWGIRSEEHTSELQSPYELVCRLLLEKKKIRISARPRRHVKPTQQESLSICRPATAWRWFSPCQCKSRSHAPWRSAMLCTLSHVCP